MGTRRGARQLLPVTCASWLVHILIIYHKHMHSPRRRIRPARSHRSPRSPAAMARGLPLSVPAWYMGPAGATIFMISFLPP